MRERFDDRGGGCCVTLESENLKKTICTDPAANTGTDAGIALA